MIHKSTKYQLQTYKLFSSQVLDMLNTFLPPDKYKYLRYLFSQDLSQTSQLMKDQRLNSYDKYSLNNWTIMFVGLYNAQSGLTSASKTDPSLRTSIEQKFGNIDYDYQYFIQKVKKHMDAKTFYKSENGELTFKMSNPKLAKVEKLKKLHKLHNLTQLFNGNLFH